MVNPDRGRWARFDLFEGRQALEVGPANQADHEVPQPGDVPAHEFAERQRRRERGTESGAFSRYESDGYPPSAQDMHQAIDVPPGDGALVELIFAEPGTYPFVTHEFSDASKRATGLFRVR